MSFRQKLEEKALWFAFGIAVATLAVYLNILQLFGLSVVRRDDYMLRADVAENYIRKDEVYEKWIPKENVQRDYVPKSHSRADATPNPAATSSTPTGEIPPDSQREQGSNVTSQSPPETGGITQNIKGFRFQIRDCSGAPNFGGALNVTCNILVTNLESQPRDLLVAGQYGKLSVEEGPGSVSLTPSGANDNFGDALGVMVNHVGPVPGSQEATLLPGVPAYIGTLAVGAPKTVSQFTLLQLSCWSRTATPHQFMVVFQNLAIRK
jgi:hypothetical protein